MLIVAGYQQVLCSWDLASFVAADLLIPVKPKPKLNISPRRKNCCRTESGPQIVAFNLGQVSRHWTARICGINHPCSTAQQEKSRQHHRNHCDDAQHFVPLEPHDKKSHKRHNYTDTDGRP